MANFKLLIKDTAIYGLSSILGRFLNYLLVPLYAYTLANTGDYGVITNLYAWTGLLLVILTYGMETTYFRFANKEGVNHDMVYSTILKTVLATSCIFVTIVLLFLDPISGYLGYSASPSYIWVMASTVAIDAVQAIPFVYLRHKRKSLKFASLKLLFIISSISLNLIFYAVLPYLSKKGCDVSFIYDESVGPGYVFYINLFCTSFMMLFLYKEFSFIKKGFDFTLLKEMLKYSFPMLLLGVAGILNQTADKILFPKLYNGEDADAMLGIYGASSKIAAIMMMLTQAFRYAYEPFVFGISGEKDNRRTYALGMKYFIIVSLLVFLGIMAYLDVIKFIVKNTYWSGLKAVPILMIAQILMGIYFNLSFWYKLTDKTIWGAIFSFAGCTVVIIANVIFVPSYGFMACAWSGVAGYATAMVLSYIVGQRYYPVEYPLKQILSYSVLCTVLFVLITLVNYYMPVPPKLIINTLLVIIFIIYMVFKELTVFKNILAKIIRKKS